MKAVLAGILLMLSGSAFALDKCYNGPWYSPERSGEGIFLTVTDDTVAGAFYTYLIGEPFWTVFAGDPNKPMVMYTGQKVSEFPWKANVYELGFADVLPVTPDLIIFTWHLDILPDGKFCLGQCDGQYVYTRSVPAVLECKQ